MRALSIAQGAGEPDILWKVETDYSQLLEKQGNSSAAIFFGKQAVNTIQSMRGNVAKMGKETLKSFTGTVYYMDRRLAGLLIDKGRLPEAQQVMDMLKEEEYFDFVRRDENSFSPSKSA